MRESLQNEKVGLIIIIALIVASLTWIASYAIGHKMGADSATLVGVIAGGLVAFGKDLVAALRSYHMAAQLERVTNQLAASAPPTDVATGKPGDAVHITEDSK